MPYKGCIDPGNRDKCYVGSKNGKERRGGNGVSRIVTKQVFAVCIMAFLDRKAKRESQMSCPDFPTHLCGMWDRKSLCIQSCIQFYVHILPGKQMIANLQANSMIRNSALPHILACINKACHYTRTLINPNDKLSKYQTLST